MVESDAELKQLRVAVAAELLSAQRLALDLADELASLVGGAVDAPPDDEHDAEGSTIGFERARVGSLLDHTRLRASELEQAAERMRQGDHGTCARCGRRIDPRRLAALPTTRTCVDCASMNG